MGYEEIFTVTDKDFLDVHDFMEMTGLADGRCYQIIREIKSVSDIFKIAGMVHRVDYYNYIVYRTKNGGSN